jgi:hypothetical protein
VPLGLDSRPVRAVSPTPPESEEPVKSRKVPGPILPLRSVRDSTVSPMTRTLSGGFERLFQPTTEGDAGLLADAGEAFAQSAAGQTIAAVAPTVATIVGGGIGANVGENYFNGIANNPSAPEASRGLASIDDKILKIGDPLSDGRDIYDLFNG